MSVNSIGNLNHDNSSLNINKPVSKEILSILKNIPKEIDSTTFNPATVLRIFEMLVQIDPDSAIILIKRIKPDEIEMQMGALLLAAQLLIPTNHQLAQTLCEDLFKMLISQEKNDVVLNGLLFAIGTLDQINKTKANELRQQYVSKYGSEPKNVVLLPAKISFLTQETRVKVFRSFFAEFGQQYFLKKLAKAGGLNIHEITAIDIEEVGARGAGYFKTQEALESPRPYFNEVQQYINNTEFNSNIGFLHLKVCMNIWKHFKDTQEGSEAIASADSLACKITGAKPFAFMGKRFLEGGDKEHSDTYFKQAIEQFKKPSDLLLFDPYVTKKIKEHNPDLSSAQFLDDLNRLVKFDPDGTDNTDFFHEIADHAPQQMWQTKSEEILSLMEQATPDLKVLYLLKILDASGPAVKKEFAADLKKAVA